MSSAIEERPSSTVQAVVRRLGPLLPARGAPLGPAVLESLAQRIEILHPDASAPLYELVVHAVGEAPALRSGASCCLAGRGDGGDWSELGPPPQAPGWGSSTWPRPPAADRSQSPRSSRTGSPRGGQSPKGSPRRGGGGKDSPRKTEKGAASPRGGASPRSMGGQKPGVKDKSEETEETRIKEKLEEQKGMIAGLQASQQDYHALIEKLTEDISKQTNVIDGLQKELHSLQQAAPEMGGTSDPQEATRTRLTTAMNSVSVLKDKRDQLLKWVTSSPRSPGGIGKSFAVVGAALSRSRSPRSPGAGSPREKAEAKRETGGSPLNFAGSGATGGGSPRGARQQEPPGADSTATADSRNTAQSEVADRGFGAVLSVQSR